MVTDLSGDEHSPDEGADVCTAVGTAGTGLGTEHTADPWGVLGGALVYLTECNASPRLHTDTVGAARDAADALMRALCVEPAEPTGRDPADPTEPDTAAWAHPRQPERGPL